MAKSALFCRSENRASAAITFTRCWRGREGGTEGEKRGRKGEEGREKRGRKGEEERVREEEGKEGRREQKYHIETVNDNSILCKLFSTSCKLCANYYFIIYTQQEIKLLLYILCCSLVLRPPPF